MQAWLESMAPGYGPALMWTVVALIGLLILLVVIRIVRGLTFGTFVAGGRTRKARLAVMDATAVDSHRRLVLVRRDDVEHLILIGGPSDVVVEQNIRLVPPARRASADELTTETPRPPQNEPAAPRPPAPRPAPAAAPPRQPAPVAPSVQPFAAERAPSQPVAPSVTVSSPAPATVQPAPQREPRFSSLTAAPQPAPATPHASGVQTLRPVADAPDPMPETGQRDDAALLEELEVTLEREQRPTHAPEPPSAEDRSLDEEMSRLLSDLSGPKR